MKLRIYRLDGKLRLAVSAEIRSADQDIAQIEAIGRELESMGYAEAMQPSGGYLEIIVPLDVGNYLVPEDGQLIRREVPEG